MLDFDAAMTAFLANNFVPTPPQVRDFTSHARNANEFKSQGVSLARIVHQYGLRPQHSVLDLGSGVGRLALPLTQYLSAEGSYFGLDINLSGVAWCHENITLVYPNFRFAVINAKNINYRHPSQFGQEALSQAAIPVSPDVRFDVVCAFSLFTHLTFDETVHYFDFVRSKLNPNAIFLATWFLINEASRSGITAKRSVFDFDLSEPGPTYRLAGSTEHSEAFAYEEMAVRQLAQDHGFAVLDDVWFSGWCDGHEGQDVVVLRRVP